MVDNILTKYANYPCSWDDFIMMFQKELLLTNQLQILWRDWNGCSMESISLTQYISNYHDIVLKTKEKCEFPNFMQVCKRFPPDYGEYVEPKEPKDFTKATKYAHIYDDILHHCKSGDSKTCEREETKEMPKQNPFMVVGVHGAKVSHLGGKEGIGLKKPHHFRENNPSKVAKKV